jgi:proteic killer suppression protein
MIESFGNALAEDPFFDRQTKATRRYDAAVLDDLRVPPGNRLEAPKGRMKGFHSIKINDQWRVVFRWEHGRNAFRSMVRYRVRRQALALRPARILCYGSSNDDHSPTARPNHDE